MPNAIDLLADAGALTGVTMMSILPFIEVTVENITAIVEGVRLSGVSFILLVFGMPFGLVHGSGTTTDWTGISLD